MQRSGWAALPGNWQRVVDPTMVLPALLQCFDDALSRFGDMELSSIQVTACFHQPGTKSCDGDLISALNWFNTTRKTKTEALIAFDQEFLGDDTKDELVARLQRTNTGKFEFGPVVPMPEQHSIKMSVETPLISLEPADSGLGVLVKLPEWTASAVAWALAIVIDGAFTCKPDVREFAVRLTRV